MTVFSQSLKCSTTCRAVKCNQLCVLQLKATTTTRLMRFLTMPLLSLSPHLNIYPLPTSKLAPETKTTSIYCQKSKTRAVHSCPEVSIIHTTRYRMKPNKTVRMKRSKGRLQLCKSMKMAIQLICKLRCHF